MLTEISTKTAKTFALSKPAFHAINGPIFAKVIETHGKPAIILPKPLVQYYNITSDFTAFEISIVERGLCFGTKNQRVRDRGASGRTAKTDR